jgi:uncharacterized repeat protein (TIGR03803 family)
MAIASTQRSTAMAPHQQSRLSALFLIAFSLIASRSMAQSLIGGYSDIHDFGGILAGSVQDGAFPQAGVAFDANGNMYGTTFSRGVNDVGTVWELTASGTYKVLHSFGGANVGYADGTTGPDGDHPFAGVANDKLGDLYGTASYGGEWADGIIWEITADGKYHDVHDFGWMVKDASGTTVRDGMNPTWGGISFDGAGNMYGTTEQGGVYWDNRSQNGSVWRLTPSGVYTLLHSFGGTVTNTDGSSGPDGTSPEGTVIFDQAGNMYGTTDSGGAGSLGMLWEITAGGNYIDRHDFAMDLAYEGIIQYQLDGAAPGGHVIMDNEGYLYGTAGGGTYQCGILWEMAPNGTYTVLRDFGGTIAYPDGSSGIDGGGPGNIAFDEFGNIYGTTAFGGTSAFAGILWQFTTSGEYQVLHTFGGTSTGPTGNAIYDGYYCDGILNFDALGNLFGTASEGGANAVGYNVNTGGTGMLWEVGTPATKAPTRLNIAPSNGAVVLSWTPNPSATSYAVYRGASVAQASVSSTPTRVVGTSFVSTGLTNGATYYYRVTPVNAKGVIATSNIASATPRVPCTQGQLVLQNSSTGQVVFWNFTGYVRTSGYLVTEVPSTGQKLVGAADFDGDGQTDLLFQDQATGGLTVWYMTKGTVAKSVKIARLPGRSWKVIGLGDFNGDGHPDIAIESTKGDIQIWLLDGVTPIAAELVSAIAPVGVTAVGVFDANHDGHPDILWQAPNGQLSVWYMNGKTLAGTAILPTRAGSGWHVAAVNTLAPGSEPSLIFQNATHLTAWQLTGLTLASSANLMSPPAGWNVVGPR